MKLDYKKTAFIGFGFFAVSIAWSLYNSLVPLMLKEFFGSSTIIGSIMTIDNILAVILLPIIGVYSDKVRTKLGRRMPFILIGIPLSAILFAIVPLAQNNLYLFMFVIILFNLSMALWRSPTVALMPDLTPPQFRSQGNGVINLMGGIGTVIALLVGGYLATLFGNFAPFLLSSVVMVIALILLLLFIRESPEPIAWQESKADESQKGSKTLSLMMLLFAIFFWFAGFGAIETFFTSFATTQLALSDGQATMALSSFSLSFLLMAVPAGLLASKFGRKKLILIGLAMVCCCFFAMIYTNDIKVMIGIMLIGGVFWALVNINSLPMIVELAPTGQIGAYTGYYYFFSSLAAIISPPLYGFVHDLSGTYTSLFLYAPICMLCAIGCLTLVRHGESKTIKPTVGLMG